jgi:hypothetical protein
MARVGLASAPNEEEARAFLQSRLTLLFKTMFWSLTGLLAFLWGLYTIYPDRAPAQRNWVYLFSSAGLLAMAFIWRALLLRRPLAVTTLYRLDLLYSLGIGASFGASAYLQYDMRASGYLSLVYATFTVFARALIMPSSGARTAVASMLTLLPMTVSGLALALSVKQDVPALAFFIGTALFCAVPIVISTYGSQTIYGLRQKADAAKQLGQYTLVRRIGEGGMGVVYLAHHMMLRRDTAVKLVLPDRVGADHLERFEREVQHMSELTHPNTVAVYDYGRSPNGDFYYAMEYLGGGVDLENLVRKHGPQRSGRVAQVLAQVCGALNEAHAKQIIHRDIKPANIILCERGGMPDVAKVVDYGLVKEFAADTAASTQVVLGTPSYLAPEAITDPSTVGPAADLYALGAVGYFLLTGRKVFEGKTAVDICIAHVTKPPTPPSQLAMHVDPRLEAVLMKCLEKKPEDRYANALELRAALLAIGPSDWSIADARAWWDEYRATAQSISDAPLGETLTIPIDLDVRFA